jgi:hypothetical protein
MNLVELLGKDIKIIVNSDLSLAILGEDRGITWETSRSHIPTILIRKKSQETHKIALANSMMNVSEFGDGEYHGFRVRLDNISDADIVLEMTFAVDIATDELSVEAKQIGGNDAIVAIEHLYCFEKPVSDGGYMVLPHGPGYLVPANCPDELPGEGHKGGLIGARWTLPMFGMVRGNDSVCAIAETWWDCEVEAKHIPGESSSLDFHWRGSLGELGYPRRLLLSFAKGWDYVKMAKQYRLYAGENGLLRTLKEKSTEMPSIMHDIKSILYRWPAWNPKDSSTVLNEVKSLRKIDFGIKFFFPKWSSEGYSPDRGTATTADAGWQSLLLEYPVPGGWESLIGFAEAIRALGCTIQGFINPRSQHENAPYFDEKRWPQNAHGHPIHDLSVHDAIERIKRCLDHISNRGLKYDALYYDGYSAYHPLPEDYSLGHPVTRRMTYEFQNKCFAETRRRGTMPSAELARFWCIPECDYFFFTDWSSDRLSDKPVQGSPAPVGVPIPLFQLVFHDCYMAGFSGGGYAVYSPGYDWWENRTPRLYELLFAAAPAYNWLPDGSVPIGDMDRIGVQQRLSWLKLWSTYYQTIAASEMISHSFLSPDYMIQQVDFANGIVVELNMLTNEFRITNVDGLHGDWEKASKLMNLHETDQH